MEQNQKVEQMEGVYFYYLRSPKKNDPNHLHPFGCVAIKEIGNGKISRGVSICSEKDTFIKAKARGLAFSRMKRAENPVSEEERVLFTRKLRANRTQFEYGIYFSAEPTEFEKRILNKPENR